MELFYNGNGEESQKTKQTKKQKQKKTEEPNKSIKEKSNVEQSHALGN